jgi:hypothetical protein
MSHSWALVRGGRVFGNVPNASHTTSYIARAILRERSLSAEETVGFAISRHSEEVSTSGLPNDHWVVAELFFRGEQERHENFDKQLRVLNAESQLGKPNERGSRHTSTKLKGSETAE